MDTGKRWLVLMISCIAVCLAVSISVSAQGSDGTLTLGQPLPNQLAAGATLSYDYLLTQPSQVAIQALSDTIPLTITLLRSDGAIVAEQPNAEGALTTTLNVYLDAGSYVVRVGSANNAAGLVVTIVLSEIPVTTIALSPGTIASGVVSPDAPVALYTFTALNDPAYLYVESNLEDGGVTVRIINTTAGEPGGWIGADFSGVRLSIPPNGVAYRIEIDHTGTGGSAPFTICLAVANSGGCETGNFVAVPPTVVPTAEQPTEIPPTPVPPCAVASAANGPVNIRQSASTSSPIIGALPLGDTAQVIGISPGGTFYNILHNGSNGWVALSVVTTSGDCSSVPLSTPPTFIPLPTPQPPAATQESQPPQPTAATGPCLITITAPTFIYVTTTASPENLFDQSQPGYQLIPTGRLADNSWWQTNFNGAWIQTSNFGSSAQVTGDCSGLPVVAAP